MKLASTKQFRKAARKVFYQLNIKSWGTWTDKSKANSRKTNSRLVAFSFPGELILSNTKSISLLVEDILAKDGLTALTKETSTNFVRYIRGCCIKEN